MYSNIFEIHLFHAKYTTNAFIYFMYLHFMCWYTLETLLNILHLKTDIILSLLMVILKQI